jgi:hypothetical protein
VSTPNFAYQELHMLIVERGDFLIVADRCVSWAFSRRPQRRLIRLLAVSNLTLLPHAGTAKGRAVVHHSLPLKGHHWRII